MKYFSGRVGVVILLLGALSTPVGCSDSGGDGDDPRAESPDARTTDSSDGATSDSDSEGGADGIDEGRCATVQCERGMVCDEPSGECGCFGDICADGTSCDLVAEACVVDAPEACVTGDSVGPWAPGASAFRDASADWALADSGARGTRISVADIDGDGWADLSVRIAGTTRATGGDDFSDGGSRRTWLFKNSADATARKFVDITQASGLVATRSAEDPDAGRRVDLVIWGDVDNDGFIDAYTAYNKGVAGAGDTAEIMLNNGDGTFRFAPEAAAPRNAENPDSPGGASFVDVDRDGLLDLWVTQYAAGNSRLQDQLFKGNADATFTEVTDSAGLGTQDWRSLSTINAARAHTMSWGAAACDLNGDGTPELLSASYGRAPNHLWLGARDQAGDVTFQNESLASGYAFDDRRDWTDNESARCYCKLNPTAPDCADVPAPQKIVCNASTQLRWDHAMDREPFRLGGNSGTTVCADVNNDGWLDLLTTEIVHWDVGSSSDPSELLYNLKDAQVRFERPGNEATGLTREYDRVAWNDGDITAAVFDFDNDGRKDVYIGSTDYPGTRGHLWHQKTDGTFQKVSIADGIDHKSSHGIGIADFNRDGALDLVVGHSANRCSGSDHCYPAEDRHVRIFENTVGQNNNWLQLDLEGGENTNRLAIGARVTVKTAELTQSADVDGGHGHYGVQHDRVQHFGLGAACTATVTVRWPDKDLTEQTFVLRAGHRYHWAQGEAPVLAAVQ